jgi:hypothetical protein
MGRKLRWGWRQTAYSEDSIVNWALLQGVQDLGVLDTLLSRQELEELPESDPQVVHGGRIHHLPLVPLPKMRIDYTPGNIFESFYISLTRKELDKHLDNPSMFIDGSLTISLGQIEPEVFKQLLKSVTERLSLLFSLGRGIVKSCGTGHDQAAV